VGTGTAVGMGVAVGRGVGVGAEILNTTNLSAIIFMVANTRPWESTPPHIINEPGAFGLAAKETTVAPGYSPLSPGGWLNVTVPCSVSTLVWPGATKTPLRLRL